VLRNRRSSSVVTSLSIEKIAASAADALRSGLVLADARKVEILPDAQQIRDILLPILDWCRARPEPKGRGLVGIAAPPAAGKSLIVAWLAAVAHAAGYPEFGFLSLDGYHLPNAILDVSGGARCPQRALAVAQRSERTEDSALHHSLRELKGTPETFDAPRLLADLRAVKGGREQKLLPAYSRVLHDPVENAIRIGPEISWVFVEGNFLFMDEPPWREIRELFDRRIFIDAGEELLRARLAARHALAGRDASWVTTHFARTDGPNIRRAKSSARFADVVLRWTREGRLAVEYH